MNWPLLQNSLLVSGAATLLAVGFGGVMALWLACLSARWRNGLLGAAVVAFALPPFLVTGIWIDLLGQTGVWHRWLPLNIYTPGGTAWVLALLTWPVTLFAVLARWLRLDPALLDSDPALAGWKLIRHLLVPAAWPALGLAGVLTFVLALNNFAVPAILQTRVFTAEIWLRFNTTFDYASALRLSWPLVLAPLLLLWLCRGGEWNWQDAGGLQRARALRRQLGRRWFAFCAAAGLAILALSAALPLVRLCESPRTWTELAGAFAASRPAVLHSLTNAALTATFTVGLGLLGRRWRVGLLLWLLFLVPGVLLGVGLILLLNQPPFLAFYQSAGIVLLALTVRYLAFGWHGAVLAFRQVDRHLTDAARLDGASPRQCFTEIQWPQMAPMVAAAWYVVYLLCLWDVETLVLVIPPGGETLALRVFNLLHYGHNAQVNALCVLLLILAVAPLLAAVVFVSLRRFIWQGKPPALPGDAAGLTVPGGGPDLATKRVSFPLTPALSLGEREPLQAAPGQTDAYRSIPAPAKFPPLPKGEGRGEGEEDVPNTGCAARLPRAQGQPAGLGSFESFLVASLRLCWGALTRHRPCRSNNRALAGAAMTALAIATLGLAGCAPPGGSTEAEVRSGFFSRVEVVGSRGTGAGQFNKPRSVAVDRADNLYVVDMTGRLQKFSPQGVFLASYQMPETAKGRAKGMCCDAQGNLVVVEPHYARINHFSPDLKLLRQWGQPGTNFGQLAFPRAVAVNSRGEILLSEYMFVERVQRFAGESVPRKSVVRSPLSVAGTVERTNQRVTTDYGPLTTDSEKPPPAGFIATFGRAGGGPGEFNRPEGLGIDARDRVYVADSCNHRIQVFSADGQFLRAYGRAGNGAGELSYPYDVQLDKAGRQYVCEFGNSRIQIFDAEDRPVELLGGAGAAPGQMSNPWAIALDSKENLYVADAGNHRVLKFIRRESGVSSQRSVVKTASAIPQASTTDHRLQTADYGLRTTDY